MRWRVTAGRLLVFLEHLAVARRLALGLGDRLLAIGFRRLLDLRRTSRASGTTRLA